MSACTQPAAPIVLHGQDDFSRGHAASAPPKSLAAPLENIPPREAPVQAASVQPVASSDLPPPSKPFAKNANRPDAPAPVTAPAVSLPMIWPVEGTVIAHFGPASNGAAEDGISIASAEGEPVYAAQSGEVVFVGDKLGGYGTMVLLKHPEGRYTTYAHLSRTAVSRYDRVAQGMVIGYVGATGSVHAPQLFFAVREDGKAVDPERLLPPAKN